MSDEPWRWRPEPWWLAVGGLAGAFWGAVGGGLWAAIAFWGDSWEGSSHLAWIPLGAIFGAQFGAGTGFVVGAVLTFVVGRDLPTRTARPLAATTALVCAPVVMLGAIRLLGGGIAPQPLDLAPLLAMAGITAAATSWWSASRMPNRPRVVSRA